MALEVGSVYATAGVRYDHTGEGQFNRAVTGMRRDAARPITAETKVDVDEAGFRRYNDRVDESQRKTRRPITADTKVDVDEGGFRRFLSRLTGARRDSARPVTAKTKVDVDEAGFRRYNNRLEDSERKTHHFRTSVIGSFGAMRVGVAGAAAAGGAAVGALGLNVIKSASDINESLTKNRVLFGDAAGRVEEFSERSAKAFGISRAAALNYTGTFGNLFRALGVSREESAKTSVQLTRLAADMASFNNSTPEEALEALRSGLVGETEPLRRFGVNMNDAQLRSEALRLGLVKNTKEALDPHARALAAVALATKQTEAAHGDFQRTAGGAANQWRILRARASDMGAELGGKLLPIVTKVLGAINGLGGAGSDAATGLSKARQFIGGLVDAFADADEGGGRFIGNIRRLFAAYVAFGADVVRRIKDVFRGSGDDFRAFARGLGQVLSFISDTVTPIVTRILPGLALAIEGIAKVVRGLVRIVAGILTGDWRRAWQGAKDVVTGIAETIAGVVKGLFGGVVGIMRRSLDNMAGAVSSLLGLIADVVDVAAKVPGIGGKFKGLADEIRKAQDSVDDYRKSLRDTDKAHDKAGDSLATLSDRVREARGRYRAAKAPLKDLEKGTDDYRAAAKLAAARAHDLERAIDAKRKAARQAVRPIVTLIGNVYGLGAVVAETADSVGGNINEVLGELGAKALRFTVKRPKRAGAIVGNAAGVIGSLLGNNRGGFVGGGVPNPGSGARDDHVLVSPDGRPVALMSGTEGILNRPQMSVVNAALGIANAVMGGGMPGSLSDLWAAGLRHYQGGGQIVPVPGFPGERAARSILDEIATVTQRFHLRLTDAFGPGHKSPGHTIYGTAADFAGPDANMNAAVQFLTGKGFKVLYDGRFGSISYPGHGPSTVAGGNAHLHVEFGGATGAMAAAAARIMAPIIEGPAGTMRNIARGASRRMASAANRFLGQQGPAGGGVQSAGGTYDKGMLAALWTRAGGPPGLAKLMAAIGLAESRGDPNAYNPSGATGLWQILGSILPGNLRNPMVNARNAVAKWRTQGLGAWEAYTNGMYRQFMRGGGLLRRLNGGGDLLNRPNVGHGEGQLGPYHMRSLRKRRTRQVGEFDETLDELDDLQRTYEQRDRRYGQSEEVLLDEETGQINQPGIDKRVRELDKLVDLRKRIVDKIRHARTVAKRVINSVTLLLQRLRGSLGHAKKKDRAGIRRQIANLEEQRTDFRDRRHDLDFDLTDARLDLRETRFERASVAGTTARPAEAEEAEEAAPSPVDVAEPAERPPTAEEIAAAATAQLAALDVARTDLYRQFGANFRAVGGPVSPFEMAAGPGAFGAFGAAGGAGGFNGPLIVNNFGGAPEDPHVWTHRQRYTLEGMLG